MAGVYTYLYDLDYPGYRTTDPHLVPDISRRTTAATASAGKDSLGIVARQTVEPNTHVWSSNHCSVYPPLVNGILFPSHTRPGAADP